MKKVRREIKYFEERLYCDCGVDLSDDNRNVKSEAVYKTEKWVDGTNTDTLIGKRYICTCGKETVLDEYKIYPRTLMQYVE